MKKVSRFIAGFAALGIAVSACSDSGGTGTNSGDPLDADEANALFNQLFSIGFGGISSAPAPMKAAAAEPIPETTSSCPGGGSVTVSGNVDANSSGGTFDITETISGCVVTSDGVAFTVNGDPNIRITGDVTVNQTAQTVDIDMSMKGGFSYSADDGRSGSCAVDVSISVTGTSASVTGTVCGQSVSVSSAFSTVAQPSRYKPRGGNAAPWCFT
jgi:hypothetical protein